MHRILKLHHVQKNYFNLLCNDRNIYIYTYILIGINKCIHTIIHTRMHSYVHVYIYLHTFHKAQTCLYLDWNICVVDRSKLNIHSYSASARVIYLYINVKFKKISFIFLRNMLGISLKNWQRLKPTEEELQSGLLTQLGIQLNFCYSFLFHIFILILVIISV